MQPPCEPVTAPDGLPPQPRKNRHWARWTAAGITGAVIVAVVAAGVAGGPGGGSNAGPVISSPATSVAASTAPAATFTDPFQVTCAPSAEDSAGYCTGDDPAPDSPAPDSPAPADTPAITTSQQQALDSAQSYLSDGQGFSRAGLISQLSSSSGEGFSHADAVWAVDNSGADWNAQAVLSAQGYMSDGQGFSRAGLIDQLSSAYGEQFTLAQATYAAGKVGL